ncbi:MAG: RDD family protein [Rhizobacter sp.]|nr:RDD family protein [Bacteriovorax sp.]
MNNEPNSSSSLNSKITKPIQIDLDEFQINEDTFKPMTKGLGFHQDTKRPSFKPSPKEIKPFGSPKSPLTASLSTMPASTIGQANTNNNAKQVMGNQLPSGLEAFYGKAQAPAEETNLFEQKIEKVEKKASKKSDLKIAPQTAQLFAWIIDVLVIASFVALTGTLLVFASGIDFKMYSRLISPQDLMLFSAAIFSIYYLLYFTILDLSASPGKTIFAIRLVKTDGGSVSVKHTFTRAIISLFSGVALFLPMLLDFQGRLSDTKVVK